MKLELIDASIWDDLQSRPKVSEGYVSTELFLENGKNGRIYLFASKDKSLHCAVSLGKVKPSKKRQRPVQGLEINELSLNIRNSERSAFIDIRCSAEYKDIFTWFVKEVGIHHLLNGLPPRDAVAKALNTGRRFWRNPGGDVMDLQRQLGLWAELNCFRELLTILDSPPVTAWTGPIEEDYDFCFTKTLVEIKATLRPRHVHVISNLKQLDEPKGLSLFVWSISVAKDDKGTSVWEEMMLILSELKNKPDVQELFLAKIVKAQLRADHEKAYTINRFSIRNRFIYRVEKNFPKVTSDSFKVPLQREILGVKYTVDLQDVAQTLEADFIKAIKRG
jgi:hypothetical protein